MDDAEWGTNLIYRHAYGLTADHMERSRFSRDHMHGRDPARLLDRIKADVARELGGTEAGRERMEAIAEGIADAIEGRRPRW